MYIKNIFLSPAFKRNKLKMFNIISFGTSADEDLQKKKTNSKVMFSCGLPHMYTPVLANQQKFTSISSVWTLSAV